MPVVRRGAVTGDVHLGMDLHTYAFDQRRGPLAMIARRSNVVVPPLTEVAGAAVKPIAAFLNRDSWVVMCPDCEVSVAFVWPETPLFMCAYCWNAIVGGVWRPVLMPATEQREAVERIVGLRPLPHNRNWRGETLAALRHENKINGIVAEDA